ncbi:MAG TPA: FAD-dependent oxidoreductase [Xanthobacteraceae bacterium]
MSVVLERTRSCWMDVQSVPAPSLDREEKADVVVVGAGIAGLSTAYELAAKGRSVVVLDRGPIARGMTSRTTAHLASELDDFYHALIEMRGLELARIHYESQHAAINRMDEIQAAEGIDCDFRRLDSYLFAAREDDREILEREFEACRRVGLAVDWAERAPLSIDTGRCLRFAQQGRVHPLKYLNGLAAWLQRQGARLYGDTIVTTVEEDDGGVTVSTTAGHKIRGGTAVVATNSPINDRLAIHSKQAPYRTYVIAGHVRAGSVPDALYWNTLDPYHYVRLQPDGERGDLLIVGGEDHRTGEQNDGKQRFGALEEWARRHFPEFGKIAYRWSGQVQEPVDYCAFIGLNPGSKRVYVATGDSGQGITGGVVASLLISSLIVDKESRWQELYEPSRKPIGAATEFMRENMTVVKNFTEYLTGGDIASVEALPAGEGAVVRKGLKKIAAYRDESGTVQLHSAVCPHSGCIVHWNSTEQCWDCPCHGSHFAADGRTLNAPAISPLDPAQD